MVLGLHSAIWPVELSFFMTYGFDPVWAAAGPMYWGMFGCALATLIASKDKKMRATAAGSVFPYLTGGITEPIIFGILIPNPKLFAITMITGGITGAIFMLFTEGAYVLVSGGVMDVLCYITKDSLVPAIACVTLNITAVVLSCVMSCIVLRKKESGR